MVVRDPRSAEDARQLLEPSSAPGASEPKRGWTRTAVNFLLDVTLLLAFVTILGVSAIVHFIFPPSSTAAGWTLWGRSLDEWRNYQFAAIAAFALCVLLHVMMHWSWVCGVISNKLTKWRGHPVRINEASKTLWGVGFVDFDCQSAGAIARRRRADDQRP